MSKKTFRIVITISLLGCLLYYTMNQTQKFQTNVESLTLDLEVEKSYFQDQLDSINQVYQTALDSLPLGSPL